MKRHCGILMPVFALPGDYGTGTFGRESYDFIDFLAKSDHDVWQMLPIGQTTFGDSPYQTVSDKSFNPYFCDLEDLYVQNLITKTELDAERRKVTEVNYAALYKRRYALLKKAYSRFLPTDEFLDFVNGKEYYDYAIFVCLKSVYGELKNFPDDLKRRKKSAVDRFAAAHYDEILFYEFIQFTIKRQFGKLRAYAKEKGVYLMGDLPLYVAADSEEVWRDPSQFCLDENLNPKKVAGVPPDYFSAEGQLWGNPVYDYAEMKKNDFRWWKRRIAFALNRYDFLRIDHFRGLDRFWSVPAGKPAVDGEWEPACGREILSKFPKNRLIAEDLGTIDDGVRDLLDVTGLRGMKVLLFAFDGNPNNPYLPENVDAHSVAYVGTHDNDTAVGYIRSLDKSAVTFLRKEIAKRTNRKLSELTSAKKIASALTDVLYGMNSDTVISSFGDLALLGNEYRINEPSTMGNWVVRYKKEFFTDDLAARLRNLARLHSNRK